MVELAQPPHQSPLYHAQHASRYDRQAAIIQYQEAFSCRLIVFIDSIFADSIAYFEELIYDADPKVDLHILLASPGGDGETAVQIVRSAQSRCRELTVIVPDQAKSAATLLALGAHHILMGPTSDLGPIDPQFRMADGSLASAKDIIAAVEAAELAVQSRPETYPIHASLLANLTSLMVQQARSALARTDDLMNEALMSNTNRSDTDVAALCKDLQRPLITLPKSHAAIFGSGAAKAAGLPVVEVDPASSQWQSIWRLWTKYVAVPGVRVYEGERASWIG